MISHGLTDYSRTLRAEVAELCRGRTEGMKEGQWVLIDFVDIVVHVFDPEARELYRLDDLWGQVPHSELADGAVRRPPRKSGATRTSASTAAASARSDEM